MKRYDLSKITNLEIELALLTIRSGKLMKCRVRNGKIEREITGRYDLRKLYKPIEATV